MLQEMYVATVTSPTGLWSLSWRFSVFQYFISYKKASRCVIKPITWHLHYQNGHYSICRKLCFNFLYIEAGEEENEQNRRTSGSALKICSWNFYSSFWMYSPLPCRLLGVNICVFPMPEGLISKTSDWKKKNHWEILFNKNNGKRSQERFSIDFCRTVSLWVAPCWVLMHFHTGFPFQTQTLHPSSWVLTYSNSIKLKARTQDVLAGDFGLTTWWMLCTLPIR